MADCFYHTGRPSVARCKQCGRPLCGDCKIVGTEGIFCSDKCLNSFGVFARRAEELEEKKGRTSNFSPIRLIGWIIVIAALYFLVRRFLL